MRRFLWRRNKGHLQEVVCERAQNASRIIRSAVMTDNKPQLIRGKERDLGGGRGGRGGGVLQRGRRKSPEIISHSAMKLSRICISGMPGPHCENVSVTGMCPSH